MARNKNEFTLSVIGQAGVVYYGDCQVLFVPSDHDVVAIMAHHTPMIMKLGKGKVMVKDGGGQRELATIEAGLLYVGDDTVSVLIN